MLKFKFSFDVPTKGLFESSGFLEAGTRLAILGPSGCGKTTFLKSLVGLAPKQSGKISWVNQEINQELLNEGILGFCFQSSPLFSHLNVLENMLLPLDTLKKFQPLSRDLKKEKALSLLSQAGLKELAPRLPLDLSGGERKRVSLLRSIIFKAPLLILDEPFSDLDKTNRLLFKEWLKQILAEHKGVLIYVTHHESDVENLANLRFDWPINSQNVLDFSKAAKL
jgi:ABC-type nitrate/sulfonate/bicarbonate transport system ATPase subunit